MLKRRHALVKGAGVDIRWMAILVVALVMSVIISACGGSSSAPPSSGTTPSSGNTPSAPSTLGTPGSFNCVSGSITAAGSTALAPLVTAVAKDYQAKCPGASITVNLGGSGVGLASAENGSIQIGDSDIFKKAGQDDLVDHQVAVVVFTLVINSKVTGVTNLTTAQVKSIYSGTVTNWKQVGGPNLPIVVISRPTTSGTRATFQTYILGGPETIQGPASLVTDSTGTVATEVNQTAGAIGYVTLGAAKKANLTTVSIDGNAPDPMLAENNTYKFWNIEHMYTKGPATGLAQALIDYMLSDQGKQEGATLAFVAITDMQQTALQTHQPTS
jgi:phosphate transport system substrate-binding protein